MAKVVIARQQYSYAVKFEGWAPGDREAKTKHIKIEADSDFLARNQVVATEGGSSAAVAQMMLIVRDVASGRMFMNEPLPVDALFGSGEFPYHIPLGGRLWYLSQLIEVVCYPSPGFVGEVPAFELVFNGEKLFLGGDYVPE